MNLRFILTAPERDHRVRADCYLRDTEARDQKNKQRSENAKA